jgi:hypothetical protein
MLLLFFFWKESLMIENLRVNEYSIIEVHTSSPLFSMPHYLITISYHVSNMLLFFPHSRHHAPSTSITPAEVIEIESRVTTTSTQAHKKRGDVGWKLTFSSYFLVLFEKHSQSNRIIILNFPLLAYFSLSWNSLMPSIYPFLFSFSRSWRFYYEHWAWNIQNAIKAKIY